MGKEAGEAKGRRGKRKIIGVGRGRKGEARDKKNWRSRGAEKKEVGMKGSCERISRGENRRKKRKRERNEQHEEKQKS